jgi:hypothetical protein
MKTTRKSKAGGTRASAPRRPPALADARGLPPLPKCNPQCERFAACQPDSPGWVLKKQAAANLASSPSALRQRAARLGYVSPCHNAMPRSDQPKLCLDGAYFVLQARVRAAQLRRRAGEN